MQIVRPIYSLTRLQGCAEYSSYQFELKQAAKLAPTAGIGVFPEV